MSRNLVLLPTENETKENTDNLTTNLIFPAYQNDRNEVRISEQESRIIFCQETERYHKELYYAIEVPTASKYNFTDEVKLDPNGQSALSDLSLFCRTTNSDNRIFKKLINIEFKAHNVDVSKDLLKLAAEPVSGLFFHTLPNINSGTLINKGGQEGVFDKYMKIEAHDDKFMESTDGDEKFILFAICIIEKKVLLMKTLRKSNLSSKDNIDNFFSINYDKICKTTPSGNNGWIQIHFK